MASLPRAREFITTLLDKNETTWPSAWRGNTAAECEQELLLRARESDIYHGMESHQGLSWARQLLEHTAKALWEDSKIVQGWPSSLVMALYRGVVMMLHAYCQDLGDEPRPITLEDFEFLAHRLRRRKEWIAARTTGGLLTAATEQEGLSIGSHHLDAVLYILRTAIRTEPHGTLSPEIQALFARRLSHGFVGLMRSLSMDTLDISREGLYFLAAQAPSQAQGGQETLLGPDTLPTENLPLGTHMFAFRRDGKRSVGEGQPQIPRHS